MADPEDFEARAYDVVSAHWTHPAVTQLLADMVAEIHRLEDELA